MNVNYTTTREMKLSETFQFQENVAIIMQLHIPYKTIYNIYTLSMQTYSIATPLINIQLPSLRSFNEFPSKQSTKTKCTYYAFFFL